jgi:hypothetical protein
MRNDIILEPESEKERKLLDQLAKVRRFALEEAGLSPSELSMVFNQFAIGCHLAEQSDVSQSSLECPECEEPITDVDVPGIGQSPVGVPCGCELSYEDVPRELLE